LLRCNLSRDPVEILAPNMLFGNGNVFYLSKHDTESLRRDPALNLRARYKVIASPASAGNLRAILGAVGQSSVTMLPKHHRRAQARHVAVTRLARQRGFGPNGTLGL